MNLKTLKIGHNIKLQLFLLCAGILFVYKIFFYSSDSFILTTLNEVIVFFAFLFLTLYMNDVFASKKFNPMSLVMNLGILTAILFLAITFSDSFLSLIFGKISDTLKSPGVIFSILSFVYVTIFAAITIQIFLIFKEFYFLNQKRSSSVYFNTMVVFFLLASVSSVFNLFPHLSYIKNTFVIISDHFNCN